MRVKPGKTGTKHPLSPVVQVTYLQVSFRDLLQLPVHAFLESFKAVIQLLLEELQQQMTRQQQLMVCEGIRVVLTTLTINLHGTRKTRQWG